MSEHSIEFLGQKFSYPSTWQGAFSVLVICSSLTVIAVMLSPEQVNAYGSLVGSESEKSVLSLTEKLSQENISLRADILQLADSSDLPDEQKQEIVLKVESSAKEIDETYTEVIEKQLEKSEAISLAIPKSHWQQQQMLSVEQARLIQLTGQLQQQQQQQKQR